MRRCTSQRCSRISPSARRRLAAGVPRYITRGIIDDLADGLCGELEQLCDALAALPAVVREDGVVDVAAPSALADPRAVDAAAAAPLPPSAEPRATEAPAAVQPPTTPSAEDGPPAPKFCYRCGSRLPARARFCPQCGERMELTYE